MTSSIICGVDDSLHARTAGRVAAQLAERLGLRLRLVHATPVEAPPPVTTAPPAAIFDRAEIRRAAEREIADRLAELCDELDVGDAAGLVEDGSAAERLAAVAAEESAAFIVVGTRGDGAVRAALLGSVSIATVLSAPCPVIVVPPAVALEHLQPFDAAAIVCGARGLEDRSVVHGAARLAADLELPLTVAHVIPSNPASDAAIRDARTMLKQLVLAARRIAPRVSEPVLLPGDPAQQLARLADELPAALLVVGTRGRGPIRSGLLGSVSRSLACSASVPVVIDPLRSRMAA